MISIGPRVGFFVSTFASVHGLRFAAAAWNSGSPGAGTANFSYSAFASFSSTAFANAVGEDEAKELYETYSVPGSGVPIFQAAAANLNPWTEAKVDTKNPMRGPMLIISGELDHTVPWVISNASYKKEKQNKDVTEIEKIPKRGHALTIDSGWREVADKALGFIKRFIE